MQKYYLTTLFHLRCLIFNLEHICFNFFTENFQDILIIFTNLEHHVYALNLGWIGNENRSLKSTKLS